MRTWILCALALSLTAPAFAQNPPPAQPKNDLDPANDPAIRRELERIHDELSNMLKQQTEVLRTITPNAGIIPMNGGIRPVSLGGTCANGGCERLYGPGRTGLVLIPLSPDYRVGLKIDGDTGVLVKDVYPDTPADIAGYRAGDILLEFNNMKVPNDLSAFMGSAAFVKNDVPVQGTVLRNDKRVEMGEMRLTDRRVIPAPVMIGDLTPTAINPRDQPVSSNGGNGSIQPVSINPNRALRNPAAIERYDGVRQVPRR